MERETKYFEGKMVKEELEKLPYLPTICDLLRKCEKDYADMPALGDENGKVIDYKTMLSEVARRRAFLYEKGLKDGAHVAVMARNTVEAMEWYLAVPTAGCVLMMLPTALTAEKLAGVARKFDLSALIAAPEFMPLTEGLPVPVYPSDSMSAQEGEMAAVSKKTVAAIYFTGGTTGAPKGAVLSHGALMRGAKNGTLQPGPAFGHSYIAMLPLSHIFGSVRGFLACLYTGSLIYACPDMRGGIMNIPRFRPTTLVLVPGLAEIILGIAKMKGAAFLGALKTILCGAAPVPPRLMKQFEEFHVSLLAGYGLTEGANLTSGNCDTFRKPESMGMIYPEQEYKVVDGELWIRGDNVMEGYYKEPEKTAEVMTEDGWLKTGDLVTFDEEGFITIVGRIKNLIILANGENVSPEALEELFYKEDLVKECLVKAVKAGGDEVIGIEIFPFAPAVEGMDDAAVEKAVGDMVARVNATLPSYERISRITVRKEEFKKTGAMKIARNQQ